MSSGRLHGRVAFVSAAADGIGRAIAQAFAAEGAAVMCTDIDAEGAARLADEIAAAGGRAAARACDVADAAAVRAALAATAEAFGALHVLVSNAALFQPLKPLEQFSEAEWEAALRVNLTGSFLLCKHAIAHIRAAGGGSIILTASQMARVAAAGQVPYCTTKGALLQLAKGLAIELAADGIRVNTLSPGAVATGRLVRKFGDLETAERVWGTKHVLGRLGRVEEIARAAVFLACEDSAFMTGTDLLVDGGFTAW